MGYIVRGLAQGGGDITGYGIFVYDLCEYYEIIEELINKQESRLKDVLLMI